MTIHQATQRLTDQLSKLYKEREAKNIADLVMEHITGWKRTDRLLNRQHVLMPEKQRLLEKYSAQLLQHQPVQYVLGEAWFYGMKLYVNGHVLIPRPETEELVSWAVHDIKSGMQKTDVKIMDAGTGSGCIAMALKKNLPGAQVHACDVSSDALQVAEKNASLNDLRIKYLQCDFLRQEQRNRLPDVDVLISNPPYIPLKDKEAMHANVLQYEPHLALFVQDNDPVIFYRAIADFAQTRLRQDGAVYVEIHEDMAASIKELFQGYGFTNIQLRKDLQGKDRMVKVVRS